MRTRARDGWTGGSSRGWRRPRSWARSWAVSTAISSRPTCSSPASPPFWPGTGSTCSSRRCGARERTEPRVGPAVIFGLVIGLVGGAVGVILGTLRMPALLRGVGLTAHRAVGTNLVVGFLLGVAGFAAHALRLEVDWDLLARVSPGPCRVRWLGARATGRFTRAGPAPRDWRRPAGDRRGVRDRGCG